MALFVGSGASETLSGTIHNDSIFGRAGDDLIFGGAGNDRLFGQVGEDELHGEGGADIMDGGAGADVMSGGAGNDTYHVDNADDLVVEAASGSGGGMDAVYSVLDFYRLTTNVENLFLTGHAIEGRGNTLANRITGTVLNNTLLGLAGDDILTGLGGDDTLDGGAGVDRMEGGSGNDAYYLDNAGDVAVEAAGGAAGGVDIVYASVSRSLGANLENLRLYGSALLGEGNGLANTITGNNVANTLRGLAGDDVLNGNGGRDVLDGGGGSDTALYDHVWAIMGERDTAQVVEANLATGWVQLPGAGHDRERLLSIENLWAGDGDDILTGSNGANVIHAGAGANVVNGGGGNDVIHGGWFAGKGGTDFGGSIELLQGGDGNDTIHGNGNLWDDGLGGRFFFGGAGIDIMDGGRGNDRLVASLITFEYAGNTMIGGGGADRFEFTDELDNIGYLDDIFVPMLGTILDFNRGEGDRIVIDRSGSETPRFAGEVDDFGELARHEYGYLQSGGDTYLVYAILEGPVGPSIKLEDYSGEVRAGDVLFV
jgi:Ca2+-binding RTX toxin-like protein